ncbi:C-C chemokine receptor type 10 [Lampris incognitus]|uniref:C-C chemokine receptor type 10 n=1 Tax=Lampris incognitus TaxID=2546036 RepID=UPI0024B580EB|nr:C-C chemokine receptor type 10 [Lampris incognitus]
MDNTSILGYDFFDVAIYDDFNCPTYNVSDCQDLAEICEAGKHEITIKFFQTCVFCLIFPVGLMGNALVIATFALYRRLRLRSMTDVFLFHLAIADTLLLFTLPFQGIDTYLGWIFDTPLCRATRACYAMNTYSGLLLLALISVDRYIVVVKAQEVMRLRSQILTWGKLLSMSVWLVAFLLSLPEILYSRVLGSGRDAHCIVNKSGEAKKVTNRALIAVFCLSFLVMVICYSLIAHVLCEGHGQGRAKGWQRQRTLKLMVVLVLVFLVFQLPHTVVLSHKIAGQFCGLLWEYVTCTLAYTRCCLNPILYALVGIRFRNDVLRLMHNAGCAYGHHVEQRPESSSCRSPSSLAVNTLSSVTPHPPRYGPSITKGTNATMFQFPEPDPNTVLSKSFLFQRTK